LSVVIPARNAAPTIEAQLRALADQSLDEPWEIVVVDNGSTDRTASIVREWVAQDSRFRLVACATVGINAARNAGVVAARSDRIAFCDADDVVATGWVRAMRDGLDAVAIVGGPTDATLLNDAFTARLRAPHGRRALPTALGFREYALGGNLGVRRETFDDVAGFDDSFTYGCDEIDFCWRAIGLGHSIGFVPSAVLHYRYRSDLQGMLRQRYRYAQGSAQLARRHVALGSLPRPSAHEQRQRLVRYFRSTLALHKLDTREGRWAYGLRCAWAAGAISGWFRHGILV
jgi:glycosyltransferase involved in cell wall biosynthesis